MLKATWVFGTQNFEAAKAVRTAVFVEEQGYSLSEEFDDFDYYAWHAVIYYEEDAPIATGRVYLDQRELYHRPGLCAEGIPGAACGRSSDPPSAGSRPQRRRGRGSIYAPRSRLRAFMRSLA